MNQPPVAFNVREYGAVGDGDTLDTPAIQRALDACHQTGGGTVCVPAGNYVIGSLFLYDNITLFVDAGATLLGSQNVADYPVVHGRWEGLDRETYAPLIGGSDLKNIAVTGRGTVNGRGAFWWKMHREKTLAHPRPRLIAFMNCANVLIEGITATNSPSWTINPVNCENVTIHKVTIINPADSPNTDGINPDSSRNVHISNCHVDVGDDCVTIKSGVEAAGRENLTPCENITVTNCTMVHGHGGVVIGSETSGSVRNVVISNCVFMGTDRGIRLKSRRGRGGVVEDIRVTNVIMQDVLCPFTMNLYYHVNARGNKTVSDKNSRPIDEGTPSFRRIHFSHITARDSQYAAAFLFGLAEMPVEDISFSDVSVSLAVNAGTGLPDMADDIEPMQRAGFYIRNARGLRLDHVNIEKQIGPAFRLIDVSDVDLNASGTFTPAIDAPVIQMENVKSAFVHGCQARTGTSIFLQVAGMDTQAIVLGDNNLARSQIYLENAPANCIVGMV